MMLISSLRLAAALLSVAGDAEEARLPRSLVDDYYESDTDDELVGTPGDVQEVPIQDPQEPERPQRAKRDDYMPRPSTEPLLVRPHESIPAFFETHFAAKAWEENVWRDYLTEAPVLVPLGLAVGAGVLSHWDKPLEKRIAGSLGNRPWIGDAAMGTLVVGSVALGVLFPGEGRNGWDNLWETAEVMAVNAIVTTAIKRLVPRRRPGGGNNSFPSGHTSTAFAAASLIYDNSGGTIGVPAYGLAALTGYSRMEARRHYPSDVLAGAAIGILSAQILDHLHWGNGRQSHGIAGGGLRFEFEPLDRGAMVGFSFDY